MTFTRFALALLVVVGLAGCASSDSSAEFGSWAASQEFVVSVESAHLVVDGAITSEQLAALSSSAWDEATSLGTADAGVNIIVGNAWAFSVDGDGTNVATINALRDAPAFVGATVDYQPLDSAAAPTEGLRGTVGSQAALREAYPALVAAAGSTAVDKQITAATADGKFSISGTGDAPPTAAIALWQALLGHVLPLEAHATTDPDALDISVGTAEERAAAEGIAAGHPDVVLTVHQ